MAVTRAGSNVVYVQVNTPGTRAGTGTLYLPAAAAVGPVPPNGDAFRGMFAWVSTDSEQDPLATPESRTALIDFCTVQGVNLLFLDMYQYVAANNADEDSLATMRGFIGACTDAGITVYGLAGNTDWTDPAVQGFVTTNILGGLQTYQAAATAAQQFAGFVFDNEYWVTAQEPVDAVAQQAVLNGLFQAGLGLPIGVFTAFFLMDNTASRAAFEYNDKTAQDGEHLFDASDFVVVGTYRDDGDVQVQFGQAWYDYAVTAGIDVFMGAETIDVGNDATTYFEEDRATMEAELVALSTAFTNAVYQGVAVHSYDGWSALA